MGAFVGKGWSNQEKSYLEGSKGIPGRVQAPKIHPVKAKRSSKRFPARRNQARMPQMEFWNAKEGPNTGRVQDKDYALEDKD